MRVVLFALIIVAAACVVLFAATTLINGGQAYKTFATHPDVPAVGGLLMWAKNDGTFQITNSSGIDSGLGGSGSGNVTHTGTLTAGLPVIGNGSADIAAGTKSGSTTQFVTSLTPGSFGHLSIWDSLGNVIDPGQQEYLAGAYNFSRSPVGTLSAGTAATVVLTPCPPGLRTSDSLHPLYVTGGTAETVILTSITTCSGGSQSVTFTPGQNHGAGYAIASATAGIWEAIMDAKAAGGGTVKVGSGISVLHAHIRLSSRIGLVGISEAGTILQVATNTWAAGPAWQHVDGGLVFTVIDIEDNSTGVHISDFTGDMNNVTGITGRVAFIGTSSIAGSHIDIDHIITRNWNAAGSGTSANVTVDMYVNTNDSSIDHVSTLGPATPCTDSTGFIFVQGNRVSVTNNFATNTCDEAYVTNGPASDVSFLGNRWINGSIANHATAYHIEGANNSKWVGNSAVDPFNSVGAMINVTGTDLIVANNYVEGGGTAQNGQLGAIIVQSATARRVSITGNIIKNVSTTGIMVSGDVRDSIVSSNIVSNVSGGAGQQACITLFLNGQAVNLTGITITGNHVDHCGNATSTNDAGIAIYNVDQTAFTISNITIADNVIGDSTGTVTDYGVWTSAPSLSFTGFIIHDNRIQGGVGTPYSLVGLASFDPIEIHNSKGFDELLPTISACGGSPTMAPGSTRLGGRIIIGSGTVTNCTLTFPAFPYTPACIATTNNVAISAAVATATTTAAVFAFSASVAGTPVSYHCQ